MDPIAITDNDSFTLKLRSREAVVVAGGIVLLMRKMESSLEEQYAQMLGLQVLNQLVELADGRVDEESLDVLKCAAERGHQMALAGGGVLEDESVDGEFAPCTETIM